MINDPDFIHVAALDDLREKEVIVISGEDRPIAIFWNGGKVLAVDNRCPHLGFPLHQGTVKDGILTCHWHHARFDLSSGCAFDLFADDVPTYQVKVDDDEIYIAKLANEQPTKKYYINRLKRGLEQNIALVQAKSIIGLLETGVDFRDIIREIALFGADNHDNWQDGMTLLSAVANLWPYLSKDTKIYALSLASRRLASNCAGMPARRERYPLEGNKNEAEQLERWFKHWVLVRHRDGAERTLLTAAIKSPNSPIINDLVFGTITDRIFSATGHTLDFANKSFEILNTIGWDHLEKILPTLVSGISSARGEEESSSWRNPIDLIPEIRKREEELSEYNLESKNINEVPNGLNDILLGNDPNLILNTLKDILIRGVDPTEIAKHIAYTSALRMAHFPESNDINDWFGPLHTFTYSNAIYQTLKRSVNHNTIRGILHGAMSVYVDRFLNIPEAKFPDEHIDLESLSTEPDELLESIFENLDRRQSWHTVTAPVSRYIRLQHPVDRLIDTLAKATLREDLDFHKLQCLEAGVQQAQLWAGQPQEEHIYVAVTRHLTAHCPTRRAESQMTRTAIRLHRGESLYEEI